VTARTSVIAVAVAGAIAGCKSTGSDPSKPAGSTPGSAAAPATERWAATLVVNTNFQDFVVEFSRAGDTWSAVREDNRRVVFSNVTFAPDRIEFTFGKPGAPPAERYTLTRANDAEAKGTAAIGNAELPIKMVRLAAGEAARSAFARPQTPKGPFPYDEREVEVAAPDGGTLAGTLTLPRGASAPAAAVLLWSGSGQQDRDETIYGHKAFAIFADRLTRKGLVVLRLDDRTTGKTVGAAGTLDTEIDDAGAAIDFLKAQKEVDPKRIGMLAHSTGGMVAPNVALKHPVAFIASLAGVAIPGRDLVPLQKQIASDITGVPWNPDQREVQIAIGDAAAKGADEIKRVLIATIEPRLEKALGREPTPEELQLAIAGPLAEATQPWPMSFLRMDPRVAWKKLSIPVLLVVGDKDTQVPADVTIKALTESHAKPELVTTHKLPGLNHLFQHAPKTGLSDEYLWIEETFDEAALDTVVTWVAGR
jgi:pimeloyl-ACP methyl ester carboxylesterase